MNNIQVFKHKMFGEVRTMTNEKGETFFVGNDVAKALGYAKPQNAIATHVDKEDRGTAPIQGSAYETRVTIINESGLYSLILSSKLPQARAFKHWVTSEVLPQIRKTGSYIPTKDAIRVIQMLAPKAAYCDEVLESVSCFTTTQIAKELDMTVHDLTQLLLAKKVMYRQSGQYLLYADLARKGYARNRTHGHYDAEGDHHTRTYLVWTERGRRFIHRIVKTEEPRGSEELTIPFVLTVDVAA